MDSETDQGVFELSFTNGALDQLRELAAFLGIPNDDLQAVVRKGIKVLDLARNNNSDKVVLEGDGQKQIVNIKDL